MRRQRGRKKKFLKILRKRQNDRIEKQRESKKKKKRGSKIEREKIKKEILDERKGKKER